MVNFQTKDLKLSCTKISAMRLLSQLQHGLYLAHAKGELFPVMLKTKLTLNVILPSKDEKQCQITREV